MNLSSHVFVLIFVILPTIIKYIIINVLVLSRNFEFPGQLIQLYLPEKSYWDYYEH